MSTVTGSASAEQLQATARDHLWSHFTNLAAFQDNEIPVIVSGEGCYVTDANGKRYVDGLSGLFASQLGYSHGEELGEAAAAQMRELGYYPNWAQAHPRVVELAGEIASLAPAGLNRSFFVSGGAEAVESAWKLARAVLDREGRAPLQGRSRAATRTTGRPWARCRSTASRACARRGSRWSRASATSGTPTASTARQDETEEEFTRFLLTDLEQALIQAEPRVGRDGDHGAGAEPGRVAAPARGLLGRRARALRPLRRAAVRRRGHHRLRPARRLVRLRAVRHPARHRHVREGPRLGLRADRRGHHIDRVAEPFLEGDGVFTHGFTYGGHPVSCAVALKTIEIMRRERVIENVRDNQDALRATLERLLELPIVGDVRGTGYFFTIELTKDRDTRAKLTMPEREQLFRGYLAPALFEHGLICRAEERIAPADPDLAPAGGWPGGVRPDHRDPRRRPARSAAAPSRLRRSAGALRVNRARSTPAAPSP